MLFDQFKKDIIRCMFLEHEYGMYSEILKNCSDCGSKDYSESKHDIVLKKCESIGEELYELKRKWFSKEDLSIKHTHKI